MPIKPPRARSLLAERRISSECVASARQVPAARRHPTPLHGSARRLCAPAFVCQAGPILAAGRFEACATFANFCCRPSAHCPPGPTATAATARPQELTPAPSAPDPAPSSPPCRWPLSHPRRRRREARADGWQPRCAARSRGARAPGPGSTTAAARPTRCRARAGGCCPSFSCSRASDGLLAVGPVLVAGLLLGLQQAEVGSEGLGLDGVGSIVVPADPAGPMATAGSARGKSLFSEGSADPFSAGKG